MYPNQMKNTSKLFITFDTKPYQERLSPSLISLHEGSHFNSRMSTNLIKTSEHSWIMNFPSSFDLYLYIRIKVWFGKLCSIISENNLIYFVCIFSLFKIFTIEILANCVFGLDLENASSQRFFDKTNTLFEMNLKYGSFLKFTSNHKKIH